MKKSVLFTIALSVVALSAYAQRDDVYFVPSKKATLENSDKPAVKQSEYEPIAPSNQYADDGEWYKNRKSNRDLDDYNRRSGGLSNNEAACDDNVQDDDSYEGEGVYTSRIVRFHSPGLVVVASPYYFDYYDTYFVDPWYGWSEYYGWYSPWYSWNWGYSWSWGYTSPWCSPWYSPYYRGWWYYGRGYGYPYYASWGTSRGWGEGRYRSTFGNHRSSGNNSLATRSLGGRTLGNGSRSFGNTRDRNLINSRSTNNNMVPRTTIGTRRFGNAVPSTNTRRTTTSSSNTQRSMRTYTPNSHTTGTRSFGNSSGGSISRSSGYSGGSMMRGSGGRSFGGRR